MALTGGIRRLIRLAKNGDHLSFAREYKQAHNRATDYEVGQAFVQFSSMDDSEGLETSASNAAKQARTSRGSGAVNLVERMLQTQERVAEGDAGEFLTIQRGISTFFDDRGKFRGLLGSLKEIIKIIPDQVVVGLNQMTTLLTDINTKAGMTGELSREFRQEIMMASPEVIRLGISFDEMSESVTRVLAESGKFRLLGRQTIQELALVSKFVDSMDQLADMADDFEKVGLGVMDMNREVEEAGHRSLELGYNANRVIKSIDDHLGKLNMYGFRDGVRGLTEMAQKAIAFRLDMNAAFDFAKNVWDPDGALEVVSNLQVIGGAFGDLNDPIRLMYMATNNIEGLQDALIGATKTLATYNDEQGRFEVTGANLRRAKEMADIFGMTMEEVTQSAVAGMERVSAKTELMALGLDMDEEDMEFLTNLAQMRDGRMVIEIPEDLQTRLGEDTIALSDMTEAQTQRLLEMREEFKKLSTEEIARNQYTALQNIMHDVSFITAKLRVGMGKELSDAIETYISPDLKGDVISNESYKLFSHLAEQLDLKQEEVSAMMRGYEGNPWLNNVVKDNTGTIANSAPIQNIPEETQTRQGGTTKTETTTNSNVTLSFKTSDPLLDETTRYVLKHPELIREQPGSFTEWRPWKGN